jgi:hypothetical protein
MARWWARAAMGRMPLTYWGSFQFKPAALGAHPLTSVCIYTILYVSQTNKLTACSVMVAIGLGSRNVLGGTH